MALLETGVSTDVLDLVSRINSRLVAEGWTVTKYDVSDPNVSELYFNRLISGDTKYFLIKGNLSSGYLHTCGATGFDAGQTFDSQPGKGVDAITNLIPAPIKEYKFWGTSNYFYVSIQKQTAIYGHAGIGAIEKCGTWTGGEFAFGTFIEYASSGPNRWWDLPDRTGHAYPFDSVSSNGTPGSIRVDTGFGGGVWHTFATNVTLKAMGQARYNSLMDRLRGRSGPNQFNGQTILLPIYCYVRKQVPEAAWLYAGYPPDLRFLNIGGLDYQDSIILGPDTWDTFPILQKNGGTGQPNSATYGIAYKNN